MRIFKIQSIDRVLEWSQRQGELLFHSSKQVGTKITNLVLGCLGTETRAPQKTKLPKTKVLDSSNSILQVPDSLLLKRNADLNVAGGPIGLTTCASSNWINAWAQFLVHLPRIEELIPFASKEFDPFALFINQYLQDQKDGKIISSADSSLLFFSLKNLFISPDKMSFSEVFLNFFKIAFPPNGGRASCLIFHPEWVIPYGENLSQKLSSLFKKNPLEILLGKQSSPINQQLFPKKGGCFYDLDLFIESRPEIFITYVKLGNLWYQCDDERVQVVSSRGIRIPMQKGVLCHYRRFRI